MFLYPCRICKTNSLYCHPMARLLLTSSDGLNCFYTSKFTLYKSQKPTSYLGTLLPQNGTNLDWRSIVGYTFLLIQLVTYLNIPQMAKSLKIQVCHVFCIYTLQFLSTVFNKKHLISSLSWTKRGKFWEIWLVTLEDWKLKNTDFSTKNQKTRIFALTSCNNNKRGSLCDRFSLSIHHNHYVSIQIWVLTSGTVIIVVSVLLFLIFIVCEFDFNSTLLLKSCSTLLSYRCENCALQLKSIQQSVTIYSLMNLSKK